MTVSSIIPVNNYAGNSSATKFDFDFLIEEGNELKVTHIDKNGILTLLEEGVDYSINEVGNQNGSYIEFPLSNSKFNVLSNDEILSLALSLTIKQESEFANSSNLNLNILEKTFDYIVRILQILNRKIDRSIKVEEGDVLTPDALINQLKESEKNSMNFSVVAKDCADVSEIYKNICIQHSELAGEYYDEAKSQAEIAIQKAKEAVSVPIGTIIKVTAAADYVPEGTLYIGNEQERYASEFPQLWNNWLTGNVTTVFDSAVVSKKGTSTALNIPVDQNNQLYGDVIFAWNSGELKSFSYLIKVSTTDSSYFIMLRTESLTHGSDTVYDGIKKNTDYFFKITNGSTAGKYNVYLIDNGIETLLLNDKTLDFSDYSTQGSNLIDFTQSFYTSAEGDKIYFAKSSIDSLLQTCSYSDYSTEVSNTGFCLKWAVDVETQTFKTPCVPDEKDENGNSIQRNFVVISNTILNESQRDWSQFESGLNGKLNTDMSNLAQTSGLRRLVEISDASLMPSFYKVFEEINPLTGEIKKWCEQGGLYIVTCTSGTVEFLKSFSDEKYVIVSTDYQINSTDTGGVDMTVYLSDFTSTSFRFSKSSGQFFNWHAEGYIN